MLNSPAAHGTGEKPMPPVSPELGSTLKSSSRSVLAAHVVALAAWPPTVHVTRTARTSCAAQQAPSRAHTPSEQSASTSHLPLGDPHAASTTRIHGLIGAP